MLGMHIGYWIYDVMVSNIQCGQVLEDFGHMLDIDDIS